MNACNADCGKENWPERKCAGLRVTNFETLGDQLDAIERVLEVAQRTPLGSARQQQLAAVERAATACRDDYEQAAQCQPHLRIIEGGEECDREPAYEIEHDYLSAVGRLGMALVAAAAIAVAVWLFIPDDSGDSALPDAGGPTAGRPSAASTRPSPAPAEPKQPTTPAPQATAGPVRRRQAGTPGQDVQLLDGVSPLLVPTPAPTAWTPTPRPPSASPTLRPATPTESAYPRLLPRQRPAACGPVRVLLGAGCG